MIDSAFIHQVFGGFGLIGKSGDGVGEGRRRRGAQRGQGLGCGVLPLRPIISAHTDGFQSAVEGSKIKHVAWNGGGGGVAAGPSLDR